jgi:hypothetical protein
MQRILVIALWYVGINSLLGCTPLMPPVEEDYNEERYQARIFFDPHDPTAISGFVRLGIANSATEVGQRRAADILNLDVITDMINEQTNMKAEFTSDLLISDPRLLELAIILPRGTPTEVELDQLTRYLMEGGFVFVSEGFRIYREGLEKYGGLVWGRDALTEWLNENHPITTVFFNIPDVRLEGLWVKGRLAGVKFPLPDLSTVPNEDRGDIITLYARQYRMAVNVVVYALIQEGSKAQRLMQE